MALKASVLASPSAKATRSTAIQPGGLGAPQTNCASPQSETTQTGPKPGPADGPAGRVPRPTPSPLRAPWIPGPGLSECNVPRH
eukprot:4524427-Alexandrium_andersonii.AAC.1